MNECSLGCCPLFSDWLDSPNPVTEQYAVTSMSFFAVLSKQSQGKTSESDEDDKFSRFSAFGSSGSSLYMSKRFGGDDDEEEEIDEEYLNRPLPPPASMSSADHKSGSEALLQPSHTEKKNKPVPLFKEDDEVKKNFSNLNVGYVQQVGSDVQVEFHNSQSVSAIPNSQENSKKKGAMFSEDTKLDMSAIVITENSQKKQQQNAYSNRKSSLMHSVVANGGVEQNEANLSEQDLRFQTMDRKKNASQESSGNASTTSQSKKPQMKLPEMPKAEPVLLTPLPEVAVRSEIPAAAPQVIYEVQEKPAQRKLKSEENIINVSDIKEVRFATNANNTGFLPPKTDSFDVNGNLVSGNQQRALKNSETLVNSPNDLKIGKTQSQTSLKEVKPVSMKSSRSFNSEKIPEDSKRNLDDNGLIWGGSNSSLSLSNKLGSNDRWFGSASTIQYDDKTTIESIMVQLAVKCEWTAEELKSDLAILQKNRIRTASDLRRISRHAWDQVQDLLPVVKDVLWSAVH